MSYENSWSEILTNLINKRDLGIGQSEWAMEQILDATATSSQIGAFLALLRAKGETADELIGFRDAVLQKAGKLEIHDRTLDIVGTGGDNHRTVNISTTASIILAAAGIPVVKHGNKAATSKSGASDVLVALGVKIDNSPEKVAKDFESLNLAFAYAPVYHQSFKNVAPIRGELGIPTVFNLLGPLCNPARSQANAIGVADMEKVPAIAGVFRTRGATALVFRGEDGLDELTTTGHSKIWEISRGDMTIHDIDPLEFDIPRARLSDLEGGTPEENAKITLNILNGEKGPIRDIILLNAAAGMIAFKLSEDPAELNLDIRSRFENAIAELADVIDSGLAAKKLTAWIEQSNSL
ncbi:MAG: anthranilate phosphoribosyltransferase [Microbacteriaceae bacterium]|nr:anthranilate phosphoribosyltransferase [Microbacteriaceae bacterium]